MKKGKIWLTLVAVILTMVMPVAEAAAASGVSQAEKRILAAISAEAKKLNVQDSAQYKSYYAQAETWLASGDVDLSNAQIEAVITAVGTAGGIVDQAIKEHHAADAKDLVRMLGGADSKGILALMQKAIDTVTPALKEAGIYVTLSTDGGVSFSVKEQTQDGTTKAVGSSEAVVKQTGIAVMPAVWTIIGLVTVLVICGAAANQKRYREIRG